jgi:hypothetical protein
LPRAWTIVNVILVILLIAGSFISALIIPEFANFLGFSISIWITAFFILMYAFAELYSDIKNIETKPVFFSPWIFPVYIYSPKKNDVERHNMPAAAFIIGMLIMMFWAVLSTVWIDPFAVGVSLSVIFELILVIITLYLVSVTEWQMHNVESYMDNMLIR